MKIFKNNQLSNCNLIVDAVYEGKGGGSISGEPISTLLGTGNQGGFRKKKRASGQGLAFVVLSSTLEDKDWPDRLDTISGIWKYYGDNKEPGNRIHNTPIGGNEILSQCFAKLHDINADLSTIPPFFVFTKQQTKNSGRSVQFRGLAVPGHPSLTQTQDLVAIWKSVDGKRFQNYQSQFSILDVGEIKREWIEDLINGEDIRRNAPKAWLAWIDKRRYDVLTSEPVLSIRSKEKQLPDNKLKKDLVEFIHSRYSTNPSGFEHFSAKLFEMFDSRVNIDEVTQASVDGGRDAIGTYRLGIDSDPIGVTFFLEAKCYNSGNPVGVKEMSRLISRIKNRQFGVMVTTSYVAAQAYTEVREDKHPVIIISGRDIAEILIEHNFNSVARLRDLCEGIESSL